MIKESIVVRHLQKSYGEKTVTNNISVTFYSGQIVAVVGHNGAGKTTLLNQLNGIVSSDSGSVTIEGINITSSPRQARELVSSMPQFQVPIKGVTIQEAIECIGFLKGMNNSELKRNADYLINYLNIEKWRNTTGEKLSGGLQRLTSFAMSVIDNPSIVVLDEPTNDVDPFRRNLIWRYLRSLANSGKTVIIVSHNLFEVERYADRYLLLESGQIKKDVTMSEIHREHHLQHQISISVEDEAVVNQFVQQDCFKYDEIEKRLTFIVEGDQLEKIVSIIIELLKAEKIISYEIKPKNLSDNYEEYINE